MKDDNTLAQLSAIPDRINMTAWKALVSTTHCYMCKKRNDLGEPPIKLMPDTFNSPKPSGKWLFHLYDSHGQPPQWTLKLWIDEIFKNEDEREAYRIAWKVEGNIKGVAA